MFIDISDNTGYSANVLNLYLKGRKRSRGQGRSHFKWEALNHATLPPTSSKGIPRRSTATLTYCATFPRWRLLALPEPLHKTKKAFVSCDPLDGSVLGGSQKRPDVWYSREGWNGARGGVVGEKEKLRENGGERGKERRAGELGLVFQEKALLLLAVVLQGDTTATEDHFTCFMQAH